MSKAAAAILVSTIGAAWLGAFLYFLVLWLTGSYRLRQRLYAEGGRFGGAGTMIFGQLLGYARKEQPRSAEAARMLRGFVGVIVTNLLLVAMIVVIMIAAR